MMEGRRYRDVIGGRKKMSAAEGKEPGSGDKREKQGNRD